MDRLLLFIVIIIAITGCSSMPVKSNTPMAPYHRLVVRDIDWGETAISEMAGDEMNRFIAAQPRLSELFRRKFDEYIREIRFFDSVTYGNAQADKYTVILMPKIYTLKPSGYMPGATYTGLLMTADGKLIGRYSEERRLGGSGSDPEKVMGNIEKLIEELAEDAASRLPYAQ